VTGLLVYPRIEPLTLPKDSGTRRTVTASARRQPTGSHGEDFYTLREYVEGDDLRRIHWSATAKRDRYMIRQEETPWHARATILLDDRSRSHVSASWEKAVEAAASMCDMYHRSSYAFRLAFANDAGIRSSRGTDHYHRCLDLLATADRSEGPSDPDPMLLRFRELEAQSNVEGVLVAIIGSPTTDVADALSRCARRFRMVVAVTVPPELYGTRTRAEVAAPIAQIMARAGVKTLVLGPGDALAQAWSAMWKVWGPAPALAEVPSEGGEQQWAPKPEPV
jgi:uncharacterized protein (DUF58 family)